MKNYDRLIAGLYFFLDFCTVSCYSICIYVYLLHSVPKDTLLNLPQWFDHEGFVSMQREAYFFITQKIKHIPLISRHIGCMAYFCGKNKRKEEE